MKEKKTLMRFRKIDKREAMMLKCACERERVRKRGGRGAERYVCERDSEKKRERVSIIEKK